MDSKSNHLGRATKREKGWGDRRKGGRATPLRDRKEFHGRRREKLREFFRQEVRAKLRAVAALNNVELITHSFLSTGSSGLVGLQLRILNGVVSLLTTRIENKALAWFALEAIPRLGRSRLAEPKIVFTAFLLASTHDTFPLQRAEFGGNDSALALA
jgi:hypothetical protein